MNVQRCYIILFLIFICNLTISNSQESSNVYKSYQHSIFCNPKEKTVFPETHAEVQSIVKYAIANNLTVKPVGNLHSITDIICTEGIPIRMTKILGKQIDLENNLVTVGAGEILMDVIDFLHNNSKALIHTPAYGGITIGGAIGTGARGSSLLHTNSISQLIHSFYYVDGEGEIQFMTEEDQSKENQFKMNAFRVNLGLLGIFLNVTLHTVDDYKITVTNYQHRDHILGDGTAVEWAKTNDTFQLYWFPNSRSIVVSSGSVVKKDDISLRTCLGDCRTNFIPGSDRFRAYLFSQVMENAQETRNQAAMSMFETATKLSLYSDATIFKSPIFSRRDPLHQYLINPATGSVGYILTNRCDDDTTGLTKCLWQYEDGVGIFPEETAIAISLNKLDEATREIRKIIQKYNAVFPILGILIRFSGNFSANSLMAIEDSNPTAYLEFINPMRNDPINNARMGLAGYQAMSQMLLKKFEGRPHWGKNGPIFHSRERIQNFFAKYRTTAKFPSLMKEYDPSGIFLNKFGRRINGEADEYDKDPRVNRCALQDYCFCSSNSDCARRQICRTVLDDDRKNNKRYEYKICDDRRIL